MMGWIGQLMVCCGPNVTTDIATGRRTKKKKMSLKRD